METNPDGWAVLKISTIGNNPFYKVFGSWNNESWRLNSGITHIEETENEFRFHGESGSIYVCNKEYNHICGYSGNILRNILESSTTEIVDDINNLMMEVNNV